MSGESKRVYFDANVFLSIVNEDATRLPTINAVIQECKENGVQIITSALSITEVAFGAAEQAARALDPAQLAKIDALWHPDSPFVIADLHQLVAPAARELVRESMVEQSHTLKAADAIHLATALRVGATHLYTYDERLQRVTHSRPIRILEPELRRAQLFVPDTKAAQ